MVKIGSTLGVSHKMWTQKEKLQIILLHLEHGIPKKNLSKQFGVNLSLLYVWCKQYTEYGAERLRAQNGIPRSQPTVKEKEEYRMSNKTNTEQHRRLVVGELIREKREAKGYTQSTLAKLTGVSQQHISPVERGMRSLDWARLADIGHVLGFTLHDVQDRLDAPPYTIIPASLDNLGELSNFDSNISESNLADCINDGQVYTLCAPTSIVGLCRYSMFRRTTPLLDFLYVDEAYRKQGYGTALMRHWENAMKSLGHESVMTVAQDDDSIQLFLGKLGYSYAGNLFLEPYYKKDLA